MLLPNCRWREHAWVCMGQHRCAVVLGLATRLVDIVNATILPLQGLLGVHARRLLSHAQATAARRKLLVRLRR